MSSFRILKFLQHQNLGRIKYSSTKHKEHEAVNLAYASYESTSVKQQSNPLIILHGLFGSKSNWSSLCKIYQTRTKPHRKIIAVDARNHGDSSHHPDHSYEVLVIDLRAFVNELGIEKLCILGHSMGGGTGMLFALTYPEMVEKLIVGDFSPISIHLGDVAMYLRAMKSVKIPRDIPMSAARISADLQLVKNGIEIRDGRRFVLTNLVRKLDGSFGWRVNLDALQRNYTNLKSFPRDGRVFEGPTLFIAGGDSNYLKRSDIPKIKNIFPNSEFKFIPGSGHWVHSDKRQEFANISLEFLNRKS